jgi:DNA polymerase-3 subunit chi
LCKKIHALGHTIFVQMPDPEQAQSLDDLMWTFDQSTFIPHGLHNSRGDGAGFPVTIGQHPPPGSAINVLISLMDTIPEHYDQFPRVLELVDNTPQDKAQARDRYRVYRDKGHTLETHDIKVY